MSQLFRCRKELCQISVPSVQLVTVEVVEAQPPPISDLPTAQEEQHGEKSSWRRPSAADRDDIDTYALGRILDVRWERR